MRIGRRAALAALPLSAIICLSVGMERTNAQAGAHQYWEGTDASGAVANGESEVRLLSEKITIGIPSIGGAYGENSPSVEAEYTFVNPTEAEASIRLLYPFELVRNVRDGERWNEADNVDIRVDGKKADYTLRKTFLDDLHANLNVSYEMKKLGAEKRSEGLFSPDSVVTRYSYRVTDAEWRKLENNGYSSAVLLLECERGTRVIRGENVGASYLENGYQALCFSVDKGVADVEFFTVGGKAKLIGAWEKSEGGELTVEPPNVTETTFGAFVEEERPQNADVSEIDWYNAVVHHLKVSERDGVCAPVSFLPLSAAVRWYEYELTLPAGGSVVNTVSAPLYAASSSCGNRFVYQFNSGVKLAEGAEFRIDIQTPYRIIDSSLLFTETEGGYAFTRNSLPYGNLSLYVSDGEGGGYGYDDGRDFDPLAVALIFLAVLIAGAVAVAVVIGVKQKRRKRATEEAIRRQEMTRPVEGSVDLSEKKTDDK